MAFVDVLVDCRCGHEDHGAGRVGCGRSAEIEVTFDG